MGWWMERADRALNKWKWLIALVAAALVCTTVVLLTRHERSTTHAARRASRGSQYLVAPDDIDSATSDLRRAVDQRVIPGAALAIGRRGRTVEIAGFGRVGWKETDDPVSPDSTVYDLASLTKAVATAPAVLLLVQDGRITLDEPVQKWLPEFKGRWKERVTWRHLLTHTSGLPPGTKVRGRGSGQRLEHVIETPLNEPPGVDVQYSDVSFIVLWIAAERVAGEPLPAFLERRLFRPLGMYSTKFWPGLACDNCAPTQLLKTGEPYRGKPSDPLAHKLGMPTGSAGLFSTAHDLARFTAMVANGGELGRVRILRRDLVKELFTQQSHAGHRALGWMAFCPDEDPTPQQPCARPIAYGHTGWTGTSLWVDPARGIWVVVLTNRSYNVKRLPSLDSIREDVFLDATGLDSR